MTGQLPGVYPQISDGNLGRTAGTGAGARAIVGVCSLGVPNRVYTLTDPSKVTSLLGVGPLADAAVTQLALGGGTVYAVPVAGSIAGTVTPEADNPDALVTITGASRQALDLVVLITASGARGTAEFVYSLDGGDTISGAIATSAAYAIPGTAHTVDFSQANYTAGERYAWSVTPPAASLADIEAAARVPLTSNRAYEYLQVVQPGDSALWTLLDVLAAEAEAGFRYDFVLCEAPGPLPGETADAWCDRLLALIKNFSASSRRVMICAQWGEVLDSQALLQVRNWSPNLGALISSSPVQQSPGWIGGGNIKGVLVTAPFTVGPFGKESGYNNGHAAALEAAGYAVAYTQVGQPGYYWVSGRMAVPESSDFAMLQNRRVMDKAVTLVRSALLPYVQSTVDPADLQVSLAHTIAVGSAPLKTMAVNKEISSGTLTVPAGQDILASEQLIVDVGVTPMGYPRQIIMRTSFVNPAFDTTTTATTDQTTSTSSTKAAASGASSSSTSSGSTGSSSSGTSSSGG